MPSFLPQAQAAYKQLNMRQCRREAKASDSSSSKVHRREGDVATVQIKPMIFTPFHCTSAELFFSASEASRRFRSKRTAMSTWPKQVFRDRTCLHPAHFTRHPQPVRLEWLAPHTHEPKGVPRCGALSLLQKPLHHRGVKLSWCLC